MDDVAVALRHGFEQALARLWKEHEPILSKISVAEATRLGEDAAETAVAPAMWAAAAGESLDTREVCDLLGVTRQAVAQRVSKGAMLALPGRRSRQFPRWQFDLDRGQVNDVVVGVLSQFRERLGRVDPYLVVGWAVTGQPELFGVSPEEWIVGGRPARPVMDAAARAAEAAAA